MDDEYPLDFEGTLAALLDFQGARIFVMVSDAANPKPGPFVQFTGTVAGISRTADDPRRAVMMHTDADANERHGVAFLPDLFNGAKYEDDTLTVRMGATIVEIEKLPG